MKQYLKKIYKREDGNITFVQDGGITPMDDHHAKAMNDQFENSLILYVPLDEDGKEQTSVLKAMMEPEKEAKADEAKPSAWDQIKKLFKK